MTDESGVPVSLKHLTDIRRLLAESTPFRRYAMLLVRHGYAGLDPTNEMEGAGDLLLEDDLGDMLSHAFAELPAEELLAARQLSSHLNIMTRVLQQAIAEAKS